MPEVLELPEVSAKSDLPPAQPSSPSSRSASALLIYAITIFLSAGLLFQVQLIFAKHILPLFGGVPSVWNACMFCFQVLLLAGYGYAHLLKSRLSLRQQRNVHVALLTASVILLVILWFRWGSPLTPGAAWKPGPTDNPLTKILQLLGLSVALPFFMVSTTGPLLQSWASRTSVTPSPYRLYALSNAGSLLGLLTYPFLLEWAFTTHHQAWLWSSAYLLFAALGLTIALRLPRETPQQSTPVVHAPTSLSRPKPARYALWLAFSTCSSIILLSATNFLCENIAPIPLLWVLPLSLYLLTFMVAFDSPRWYSRKIFWPLYAAAVGIVLSPHVSPHQASPLLPIALYCLTIFAVCMVCHGELARTKPPAEHLTSFYWMIAAGGALGGTLVVAVAPHVFRSFREFHVALLGCGFLLFLSFVLEDRAARAEATTWSPVLVVLAAFLLPHVAFLVPRLNRVPFLNQEYWTLPLCFAVWLIGRAAFPKEAAQGSAGTDAAPRSLQIAWQPVTALLLMALFTILCASYVYFAGSQIVYQERNFFGVKYVSNEPEGFALFSGNTMHGLQLKDPARRSVPTLYFASQTGVGTLLRTYPRTFGDGHLRFGIIGMGVGSLAAYTMPGDYLRFYEIDPAVVGMSLGPRPIFSFAQRALGTIEVALGDARLSLEREVAEGHLERFDVLVVDAFNSDSIPVHLLTRESVALYRRHLRGPKSVLAFHLSSRFLDLVPVLRGVAESQHLSIAQVNREGVNWILLAADPSMLQTPGLAEIAAPPASDRPPLLWTDDYSNVFQVFRRTGLW